MSQLYWKTEQRIVRDLIPSDYNPRVRDDDGQRVLEESMSEFNLVDTPVINLDNTLIAGHRRLEYYIERGQLDLEIDVRVPSRMLTEDELKRYMLLSNTHAGKWDLPKLEQHFGDIYKDIIMDLPSLDAALPSAEQVTQKKDSERIIIEDEFNDLPPKNPITQLDDLYELGPHKVICADSTDVNAIGRLMAGLFAHMIFTDPPYNLAPAQFSGFGKNESQTFVMGAGEMTTLQFTEFLKKVFLNHIRYSNKGSIHFVCMDWKHVLEIATAGQVYTEFKNMIVWNKNNGGMGTFYRSKHELVFQYQNNEDIPEELLNARIDTIEQHGYESGHELVFVFKSGRERNVNNFMLGQTGRYRTNVWDYPGASSFNKSADVSTKDHPTPKPIKLVADAMMDCSLIGHIILDTFSGSGTTIIAADQTERIAYVVDLSPGYCDLNVRRYIRYCRNAGKPIVVKKNGILLTKEELKAYEIR
ncbi:DNA modification methylase [Dysgonomonas sp. HDW5B]|uniref:DNA modification methylase n=1 Tax=Dysgonomonas sp. HDW5B TaxID=2714927 RepID=UPI00140CA409|nr:DNA modification methylase [Dysgonomonas sp. HDW5B]QIK56059.1 DNA modification methylase [Dysgonomonas sp. HDW5B]